MPENFLSFKNVSYMLPDGRLLFSGVSFDISRTDKAALTGRNGIGKTTLFLLAEKMLLPYRGNIICSEPPCFLPQKINENQTVAEALGISDILKALDQIDKGIYSTELAEIIGEDWNIQSDIRLAFHDFNLDHIDLSTPFNRLSAGEREKILLLRVFLSKSHILLFDEPTNNLDTATRKVFYDYIKSTDKIVFIISHDRDLLENMNCIFELSENGLKKYTGNYNFYLDCKNSEKQKLTEQKSHMENEMRHLTEARQKIDNQSGKQEKKGKKNIQSRKYTKIQANAMNGFAQESVAKKIKKIEEKLTVRQDELHQIKLSLKDNLIKIPLPEKPFIKDKVIEISNLSFSFSGRRLFNRLNLTIKGGEKIHLKGDNGSGKTTLIRLISGELKPDDGQVSLYGKAVCLSQDLSFLDEDKTVLDNIIECNPEISINEAHSIAANFHFRNKNAFKTVKHLSGGEKLKAALATILGTKHQPDILILDEPTNNLDIHSTEILENVLRSYQGTLLIVSHDPVFIEHLGIKNIFHLQLKNALPKPYNQDVF